ncbi:MAG: translation initiation factor IF-2, partial [Clostridium sp.]
EVRVRVIHGGVGAISETDVTLASASNAIIIGFNVRPDSLARVLAEKEKVEIKTYRVIYHAIDDVTAAMKGMLDPIYKEVITAKLNVRTTFKVSSVGTIAGCYVEDGKINRNNSVRVIRDGIVIFEGKLSSLKRFKDDAKEVATGFECGITIEKFNDLKEDDVIEGYTMEEIERK